jgi:hypothetical protein
MSVIIDADCVMRKSSSQRRGAAPSDNVVRASALLDVQLLDVLAEVEALLRNGREVQREILRVRGEPDPRSDAQRAAAAARIAKIAASMHEGHRSLGTILRGLRRRAEQLNRSIEKRRAAG